MGKARCPLYVYVIYMTENDIVYISCFVTVMAVSVTTLVLLLLINLDLDLHTQITTPWIIRR